jgi:hypothetical protein
MENRRRTYFKDKRFAITLVTGLTFARRSRDHDVLPVTAVCDRRKSALICGLLTERFRRGDRTTDDSAYNAADRIPAANPETAKRATRDTEQNVADWML